MISFKDLTDFSVSTRLTMLGRDPDEQVGFVNPPVYRGSTLIYHTLDDFQNKRNRFHYGTDGSPTIANLESAWTALTGAAGTVLSPSGLGSIALAILSVVKAGDHILVPDTVYRPSRELFDGLLKRLGVETSYYDPMLVESFEMLVKSNSSVFFDAHGHGVDISVEAGTKYLGGHSDLLIGLASANSAAWPSLRATYDAIAMLPGPEDCVLALRGMRTLHVRLKEAERRALDLAEWCQARPEVKAVLHPAFSDSPGHSFWKRDFKGSSGLFSVVLVDGFEREALANMLNHMRVFSIGLSWGGYESLIIPFDCRTYRTTTKRHPEGLALRIQVGLEDLDDLKRDLTLGFDRLSTKTES